MLINRRLINTVGESRKYIVLNVVCQWISLAASILMMGTVAHLLQCLADGSADRNAVIATGSVAVMAVRHVIETARERKKTGDWQMNIKKMIFVITGCIGAGLGAVGAVVPMVQGNKALHGQSGGLCGRPGMTDKTKIRIMVAFTLLMSISFIMMCAKGIVLGCVWVSSISFTSALG